MTQSPTNYQYKAGDEVWLKADPILGCVRERAKIIEIYPTYAVMYEQLTNANGPEFGIGECLLSDIECLAGSQVWVTFDHEPTVQEQQEVAGALDRLGYHIDVSDGIQYTHEGSVWQQSFIK